jgi:hypothetical protein
MDETSAPGSNPRRGKAISKDINQKAQGRKIQNDMSNTMHRGGLPSNTEESEDYAQVIKQLKPESNSRLRVKVIYCSGTTLQMAKHELRQVNTLSCTVLAKCQWAREGPPGNIGIRPADSQ